MSEGKKPASRYASVSNRKGGIIEVVALPRAMTREDAISWIMSNTDYPPSVRIELATVGVDLAKEKER